VVCGRAPARQGYGFAATVTELALLLVEAGEVAEATLVERVGAGAVGEGWHEQASGQPPDPKAVRGQLAAPLRLLEVLGLRRSGEDWRSRWVALPSRAGRALEALRARATGPGRPARPMTSATSGGDGEPGSAAPACTPQADVRARAVAGAGGRHLEPLGPVVLHRRRHRLRW
jgi:hypothetical protein